MRWLSFRQSFDTYSFGNKRYSGKSVLQTEFLPLIKQSLEQIPQYDIAWIKAEVLSVKELT